MALSVDTNFNIFDDISATPYQSSTGVMTAHAGVSNPRPNQNWQGGYYFPLFSGDLLIVKLAHSSRPQHQIPAQPNVIKLPNYAAITLKFRRHHRP